MLHDQDWQGLEDGHPASWTLDWGPWDMCPHWPWTGVHETRAHTDAGLGSMRHVLTLSPRDPSTWWSQMPMVVTTQESTLNRPLSPPSLPLSHSPPPLPMLLGPPLPLNRQVLNTCLKVCFWSKMAGRVGIDCSGYSTHALPSGSPLLLSSCGLLGWLHPYPAPTPTPHQTPRASSWPKHPMGYTECVDQDW